MGRKGTFKNNRGFTLVELLIVVAIIGVLSTVGIPTFRRMIQKSKKSEAQVNLGNLHTIQTSFLSEYGAYGNNLQEMGFQIDGLAANLTYIIGHPSAAACASLTARQPAAGTAQATAVGNALPQYYNAIAAADHKMGRTTVTVGCMDPSTVNAAIFPNAAQYTTANGGVSAIGAAPRFLAQASGFIAPGCNKNTGAGCGAAAGADIWAMDDTRTLANLQDGVQ